LAPILCGRAALVKGSKVPSIARRDRAKLATKAERCCPTEPAIVKVDRGEVGRRGWGTVGVYPDYCRVVQAGTMWCVHAPLKPFIFVRTLQFYASNRRSMLPFDHFMVGLADCTVPCRAP